jgi:hypothetical protein
MNFGNNFTLQFTCDRERGPRMNDYSYAAKPIETPKLSDPPKISQAAIDHYNAISRNPAPLPREGGFWDAVTGKSSCPSVTQGPGKGWSA